MRRVEEAITGRSDSVPPDSVHHCEGLATPSRPDSPGHPGLLMTIEQVAVPSFGEGYGELATDRLVGRADSLLPVEKC